MSSRSILTWCICGLITAPLAVLAHGASAAGGQGPSASAASVRPKVSESKESTGYITDTECSGANQRIDLKTSAGTLHLRGPASGGLPFEDPTQLPAGFNSCKSLKGLRVSVQFTPDDLRAVAGTIKSLRLLPPEDVNSAEGPIAPVASAASTASSPNSNSALIPDARMTAEGRVTDVNCTGNEIIVKVGTATRQFTLHARDYTRLTFDDDRTSFENPDFPACTQLKGRVVAIEFIVVEHKTYDGEIRSVEIER